MTQNDIKISWRNLCKNKGFTLLNILGLTLGFTGFILSYQYINRETSYDKWNPNYKRIYQVGLEANGEYTAETPANFAPAIMEKIPEVALSGRRMAYPYGGYPMFGESTVFLKNTIVLDFAAAKIFQVKSKNGPLFKNKEQTEGALIQEKYAKLLFKERDLSFSTAIKVPMLSKTSGMEQEIIGILEKRPLSLINNDFVTIRDISKEDPYTFQTFIQVKEGTNIKAVSKKINDLFQQEIALNSNVKTSSFANGSIYLDPLDHLHLRPKGQSNTPYLMIWVIGILSIVILTLASANFANLMMAQADLRLKEIGIKKILGSSRWQIISQLLFEVLIVTLIAAIFSFFTLLITGNILQKWFNDELKQYIVSTQTILQLILAIFFTTLISGIYPAIALSGFKATYLLKGNLTALPNKNLIRNSLLTIQIVFAVTFITGMIVVHQQLNYIQQTDKGFEPSQVISFKGIGFYYDSKLDGSFQDFKQRLENDPSIETVSSVTNLPGSGELPPKKQFTALNKTVDIDHVGIDVGYFQTLGIAKVSGNNQISINQLLKDSTKNYAVINESAVKHLGLAEPIGAKISGCKTNFEIISVVQDSKTYGFEKAIQPTIYSYKDACLEGRYKIPLIIKTAPGKIKEAIDIVEKEWKKNPLSEDLPLDFEFMDQQYAMLHAKQQELQAAFNSFTIISVLIAMFGLFSMSTYQVSVRRKEISIRKILGASIHTIFIQLNRPFFKIFIIGILIAIPLAYIIIDKWLSNFAYHVEIEWWYFGMATISILIILIGTVGYQSVKAAHINPIDTLRDE